jgi:hypothetical protein
MARKNGEQRSGQERRTASRGARRIIKRDDDSSQLLERGEGPTADEQVDPGVESPSEITNEGGPASEASERFDTRAGRGRNSPNPRSGGTGGEAGYSTLGGGVYPDEGSSDDAPRHGDWQRHSSGGTSGARGQEGMGHPGEQTWGEDQFRAERRQERGESPGGRRQHVRRRPDDSLAREIHEVLTNDPELDATEIEVQVEGGAVTLSGTVDSSDAKLLAEELTESFPGVREVHNRLVIER